MSLHIELAQPADDLAIRCLCRSESMPGTIALRYEREPDFSLGCRVTGDEFQVLVAREQHSGEIAGVACRSTRQVFLNGSPRRLGYLGQLRVGRKFRGRWLVSRGFEVLRRLHERDPVPAYLVAIVDGNEEAAEILIKKARRSFPAFQPVADLHTVAVSLRRGADSVERGVTIASASPSDLTEIAAFLRTHGSRKQFFPVCTETSLTALGSLGLNLADIRILRKSGEILAVGSLWDQSAYKQTILQSYSGWRKAAAAFYNLGARCLDRPCLPRPGETVRGVYAALVAVADDDRLIFARLLRDLHNRALDLGRTHLLLGLDARDPLLPIAKRYPHVLYSSRLYLASWPDGENLHEQLDRRVARVDIATL